jgi:hypothetical protein
MLGNGELERDDAPTMPAPLARLRPDYPLLYHVLVEPFPVS